MSSSAAFHRNPLIINGNTFMSGDRTTTFSGANPRAVLRSYLIFVRDLRGQRREPSIELRTDDISVLARHLGVDDAFVVGGLLDVMGATRTQRNTVMAMLAAGALTVVLTGSFVTDLSTDGVSVEMGRLADAVQAAAAAAPTSPTAEVEAPATAAAPVEAPAPAAATLAGPHPPLNVTRPDPVAAPAAAASTPTVDVLRSAADSRSSSNAAARPTEQVAIAAAAPASFGVTDDGSLVASVAPPVPGAVPGEEPVATGELPDGTIVGVAVPPVPPAAGDETVATGELPDGTIVAVGTPPVPPTD